MSTFQRDPISVLKFGSSVLRSEADLPAVVHEIYAELRRGRRVLAVVSAFGSTTDDLLALAKSQAAEPEPRVLAQLLATGESTSAALLTLALTRAGVYARSTTPEAIGLRTEGGYLDAHPVDLDVAAIEEEFRHSPVLVLPGFLSCRIDGELALLGRGGSDLSAIFVAGRLRNHASDTRCVLVKDVDGLYEWDPAGSAADPPRRYSRISYGDALELAGDVVQHKAIRLARESGLSFEVCNAKSISAGAASSCKSLSSPTIVGAEASVLTASTPERFTRLRIGIIGHGTVGAGVLDHLLDAADDFEVTAVLVRDLGKHLALLQDSQSEAASHFDQIFTDDPDLFFARPLDVLVEIAGGLKPAGALIERALEAGLEVVTANKALLAERGHDLLKLARTKGARLLFNAAVGGAATLLESARRLSSSPVRGFEAILNGTSNYIADAVAHGTPFAQAVVQAQAKGYAEVDPTLDLDGTDAAQKAELLARELFGADVALRWGERLGIESVTDSMLDEARAAQSVVRVVASCYLEERGAPNSAFVQVTPVALPPGHPLNSITGVGSGAVFNLDGRDSTRVYTAGEGAGRWPTAEAVFADLLDLRRSVRASKATAAPSSSTDS